MPASADYATGEQMSNELTYYTNEKHTHIHEIILCLLKYEHNSNIKK